MVAEPFARLLAPAIAYARDGFPVTPKVAELWAQAGPAVSRNSAEFGRVFLPGGRAPRAGSGFACPNSPSRLAEVADSTGRAFYDGPLAWRIAESARLAQAALTLEDLQRHEATWVVPLGVRFRDTRLCELPPNGQGLAALIALGILERLGLERFGPGHPDSVHLQIEAMKLAFRDCHQHVADPSRMRLPIDELLSEQRLATLSRRSGEQARRTVQAAARDHGTVYATTADARGAWSR